MVVRAPPRFMRGARAACVANPARIDALRKTAAPSPDHQWSGPGREPDPRGDALDHRCRLLIVDDEPANVRLLHGILSALDYDVVSACSGYEAMEKLDPSVDLILLDALMPGMDGFQVAAQIRRNEAYGDTPIIMVTVLKEREDRLRALEAGANDFISKPIDRLELKARLASLLGLKKARDRLKATLRERARITFEMHHRVLNHLTLLISLLKVQAQRLENESWKSLLSETEVRLRCTSLVHETLYKSESSSKLDVRMYLSELFDRLEECYGAVRKGIRARLHVVEDFSITADTALTLGMVVAEFLAHTANRECPGSSNSEVFFSVTCSPAGEIELLATSQGPRETDDVPLDNPQSVAWQLTQRLAQQLRGVVEFDEQGSGSRMVLRFRV
ncbi:MAG: response regulator [Thermodesulfobacteriota bacterium]